MSIHHEKIENHVIYDRITDLENELSATKELQKDSSKIVEVVARVFMIINNFKLALETVNKELISINWLDESASACVNLKNQISNFIRTKDIVSFENGISSYLDVILRCTVLLNCVRSTKTLKIVTGNTDQFIKTLVEYNKQLDEEVSQLKVKIKEVAEKIDAHFNVSNNSLLELKGNIKQEQSRLDTLALSYQKQMGEDKKSFDAMCGTMKELYQESQDERKKTFAEEIGENSRVREEFDEKTTDLIETGMQKIETVIGEYRKIFSNYEEEVKNIVGIVNTNMFSHKYKAVADDAKDRAKVWHKITLILMLCVSIFAIFAFVVTSNYDTNWVKLVAKIFTTTTLATGAAYSARQASKQEKVERYARRIEMELVAIDPFLESLDEERRASIKEEISKKIFGNSNGMEMDSKDETYVPVDKLSSIEGIVSDILKIIIKK